MDSAFNDQTLWHRLLNYSIEGIVSGNLSGKNLNCIRAKKKLESVEWDYNDLKQYGVDLHLVCIDGETSYVGSCLYEVISNLLREENSTMDKPSAAEKFVEKSREKSREASIETSTIVSNDVKFNSQPHQSTTIPRTIIKTPSEKTTGRTMEKNNKEKPDKKRKRNIIKIIN